MNKQCTVCAKTAPITEFYKDSRNGGYRAACKSCSKAHHAKYLSTNGLSVRKIFEDKYYKKPAQYERSKNYRERPGYRQKNIEYQKNYRQDNPEKGRFYAAKYRASKLKATPMWLTASQLEEIRAIYANCPDGHEVDHIIPLQGKEVRGLHVPWNLQYLPAHENLIKGNRVWRK